MTDDHVEQIKSKLDIVELISGYVKLTKAGANYKGVCPFHQEKTPSFMVSAEKQIWHCFGCSEGGDAISFIQKIESMTFPEALKLLADQAGVEIPTFSRSEQGKQGVHQTASENKNRLFDVLEHACRYFEAQLQGTVGRETVQYLRKRGVTEVTQKRYRLGFAVDEWHALEDALKQQGFTQDEMKRVGLLVSNDKGNVYDRFRSRLLFPIFDIQGRVVGFGGRILSSEVDAGAKYINTPQTDIYNKSRVLYGIHEAKLSIRKNDYVVLVEGYMDVLMSHQAGVRNVVAVSGTALTSDHLTILKRYTTNVMLAFDMDSAGQRAAKRSVAMALEDGWNVKVVQLESGKDAADAILENPEIWIHALKSARPVIDYYIEVATAKYSTDDVIGKKRIAAEVFDVLRYVQDPLELSHYIQRLSSLLAIPDTVLSEAFHKALRTHSRLSKKTTTPEETKKPEKVANRANDLEEQCVGFLLRYYSECVQVQVLPEYFIEEVWHTTIERVSHIQGEWSLDTFFDGTDRSLQNACNIAMMKAEHLVSESGIDPAEEFARCYRELVLLYIQREIQHVQLLLKKAEEEGNTDSSFQYMQELSLLFDKLRKVS